MCKLQVYIVGVFCQRVCAIYQTALPKSISDEQKYFPSFINFISIAFLKVFEVETKAFGVKFFQFL